MKKIKIENKDLFIAKCLENSKIDIDSTFCKDTNFQFENHEDSTDEIDLLTTESNLKAFEFIFPSLESK